VKYSAGNYSVSSSVKTSVKTSQQLQSTLNGQSGTAKVWGES
jgi:hypothetical protein